MLKFQKVMHLELPSGPEPTSVSGNRAVRLDSVTGGGAGEVVEQEGLWARELG